MSTRLAVKSRIILHFRVPRSSGGPYRSPTNVRHISSLNHRQHEIVRIPIGLDGGVNLHVFQPQASPIGNDSGRNLLVYFPSGPALTATPWKKDLTNELESIRTVLSPSTTLVSVDYRLGPTSQIVDGETQTYHYPIPIHDVSTALDYLTSSTSAFNEGQHVPPKICLLGSHIGGALATTIALTQPNDIHALSVAEPLVDWVVLDEIAEQFARKNDSPETEALLNGPDHSRKRSKSRTTSRFTGASNEAILAAAEELIRLRSRLFKTPSAYFDPFASPLLFLRAPGRDTPLTTTVGDRLMQDLGIEEGDADTFGRYDDDWGQKSPSTRSSTSTPDPGSSEESSDQSPGGVLSDIYSSPRSTPTRRRKVLRRWPSTGRPEDVNLPHVRIFSTGSPPSPPPPSSSSSVPSHLHREHEGLTSLLRAQSTELADLLRRACFYGRESGFGEQRVQLRVVDEHEELSTRQPTDPSSSSVTRAYPNAHRCAVEWAEAMFSIECDE